MKKKELKNLAVRIAKQEMIIQNAESSKEEKALAEQEIMKLSSKVKSLEEMETLDELIQDILNLNEEIT